MKKTTPDQATSAERAEVEALAAPRDEKIDTKDSTEQRDWTHARRGALFRPIKQQITLRLDADVIEWFRQHPVHRERYQTAINRALREYVEDHERN